MYIGPDHHLFHLPYGLSEALRYTLSLLSALLIPDGPICPQHMELVDQLILAQSHSGMS